jgi:xanthosine utilization system XapX-like protein
MVERELSVGDRLFLSWAAGFVSGVVFSVLAVEFLVPWVLGS